MSRIPNMNKVKAIDFNEDSYMVKRIDHFMNYDNLGFDLSNDKSKTKFIDYVETIVRRSFEYTELIKTLKERIGMTKCSYFPKVDNSLRGITIEVHHSPFSLYDIVDIVLKTYLENDMEITPGKIAQETIFLHYSGLVGLIPVCKTVHELIHDGQIFVPINYVFGDIGEFFNRYKDYMSSHQKEMLVKNIKVSDEIANTPPSILKKKFVYLDVEGFVMPAYVKKIKKKK